MNKNIKSRNPWHIQHWGHWERAPPPMPKYNWNLINVWRRKCLAHNITSAIRNWTSLATMKLLTTSKYNILKWLKNTQFSRWNIFFFRTRHPRTPYLLLGRITPRSSLVADRHLCYYRTYDLCVTHPRTDLGVDAPSLTWRKINKATAKNHALECKANSIKHYF